MDIKVKRRYEKIILTLLYIDIAELMFYNIVEKFSSREFTLKR